MRWIAILSTLTVVCATAGCARGPIVSGDPLGAAPSDFALELTILADAKSAANGAAHLRQSRYVLFPDGSLHHGEDLSRARSADWLPPLTRVLTRRQVTKLWMIAQEHGFADSANSPGAFNFNLVAAPPEGVAYLLAISGWGERWGFERSGSTSEPDAGMTALSRELAQLSWTSDQPRTSVRVLPRRYNFGPDPYARFRQPGGAPAADVPPQRASESGK